MQSKYAVFWPFGWFLSRFFDSFRRFLVFWGHFQRFCAPCGLVPHERKVPGRAASPASPDLLHPATPRASPDKPATQGRGGRKNMNLLFLCVPASLRDNSCLF